ncbi:MAG: sensor domain-containing diguanylate cyclase [Lachnospiraceae bacterium]|nr:sensor domain-containing diguanylate cyclase [Lachnospiraceae bacterium]
MKNTGKKLAWGSVGFVLIMCISTVIVLADFQQGMEKREYEMQLEALQEYSQLDAVIVERTLEGYLSTMEGMASFLGVKPMDMEDGMAYLESVAGSQDFKRLGLVDEKGILWATDGSRVDISDRSYLRDVREQKSYVITESENSRITGQEMFVIAMPVLGSGGELQGILHGAIQLEDFEPYESIESEEARRYIQVIDRKGNYILRNYYIDRGMPEYDTFFEGLLGSEGDMPGEDLIAMIQSGETILTERNYEGTDYIEYFQPLQLNEWYVVTSLQKEEITLEVSHYLRSRIYPLIIRIVCIIMFACGAALFYLRKMGGMELKEEEKLREQLLSGADGFLVVDVKEDRILQGTEELLRPCGKEASFSELLMFWEQERIPEEYHRYTLSALSVEAMAEDFRKGIKTKVVEYPVLNEDGGTSWTECEIKLKEDGERLIAYNIYRDISSKKQMELLWKEEAERDYLTGLYNRSGCMKQMEQLLQTQEQREGRKHAFVLLDLDNFKAVNDRLGHNVGDKALQEVAGILREHFREYDLICRLGGDEFVVLLQDMADGTIEKKMNSVLEKLRLTFTEGDVSVSITASAGIALIPDHGVDFERVYRKADAALYKVKEQGKDSFEIFMEN